MSSDGGVRVLAEASGVVVAESGARVLVVDRRIGGLSTTVFVLMLCAVIPLGAGLAFTVQALLDGAAPPVFGLVLLGVAVVAFGLLLLARRAVRGRRARPVGSYVPVAVFDRAAGVMVNSAGQVVAPLHQVRVGRRMQLTSSSPMLVADTPGGRYVLGRGNPFAGGLGDLEAVLHQAVFGPGG